MKSSPEINDFDENNWNNWDFAGADTKYLTHGIHPYPARMIPQIARRLIRKLSNIGDTVFDPFCGSGTVIAESRLLGRNSLGIDLNPLAVMIAKVKSTPIDSYEIEKAIKNVEISIKDDYREFCRGNLTLERTEYFNLDYWFKPRVIDLLTLIKRRIWEFPDDTQAERDVKDFLKVVFSYTVRLTSNNRPGEFKLFRLPPDKLDTYNPDPIEVFINHLTSSGEALREYSSHASPQCTSDVQTQDARTSSERQYDLVVTSPPYGDHQTTVAYGQFSRYSAFWLDFDEKEVRSIDRRSLGGIRELKTLPENDQTPTLENVLELIEKRDTKRMLDVLNFYTGLSSVLQCVTAGLKDGGFTAWVIGNRTVKRIQMPTHQIVKEMGEKNGLSHVETIPRNIPTKRMPWINAPENIPGEKGMTISTEHIVIMKKS